MTYDLIEASVDDGSPVELYEFSYSGGSFRYANVDLDVDFLNEEYSASTISRPSTKISQEFSSRSIEITLERNAAVGELYRTGVPSEVVQVLIRQRHYTDDDSLSYVVVWSGRVLSATWEDEDLVLYCEHIQSSLRRTGLRRLYQTTCSHLLYGDDCKVNKADYTYISEVLDVDGDRKTLTLDTVNFPDEIADDFFAGGYIEWVNPDGVTDKIAISDSTGASITVFPRAVRVESGYQVTVYAGCKHTVTACKEFGNEENFGGMPYFVNTNPFTTPVI